MKNGETRENILNTYILNKVLIFFKIHVAFTQREKEVYIKCTSEWISSKKSNTIPLNCIKRNLTSYKLKEV